jgi:hypothetical protein
VAGQVDSQGSAAAQLGYFGNGFLNLYRIAVILVDGLKARWSAGAVVRLMAYVEMVD